MKTEAACGAIPGFLYPEGYICKSSVAQKHRVMKKKIDVTKNLSIFIRFLKILKNIKIFKTAVINLSMLI